MRYFKIEGIIQVDDAEKESDLLEIINYSILSKLDSIGGEFGGGIKEIDENGEDL
jgi:hypothetical protein